MEQQILAFILANVYLSPLYFLMFYFFTLPKLKKFINNKIKSFIHR